MHTACISIMGCACACTSSSYRGDAHVHVHRGGIPPFAKYDYIAYLLVRDMFSVLGNSKCEVLCGILPYFGSALYIYQRMPMGLNISPSIWQSYINAILDFLETRKNCEVIMDDLLLFTPSKKAHMAKLDLLRVLLKNGLKISPKMPVIQNGTTIHGEYYIYKRQKGVC